MTTRREQHLEVAAERGLGMADWRALGTAAQLVITDPAALAPARAAVEAVLADIDVAASRFRDDSELSRLNTAGNEWRDVSALFARALRVAVDAAAWSDGLVDPTVGAALVGLGYDRTFSLVAAEGPAVSIATRAVPGWRSIELDETNLRARWPGDVVVDLGATAKGLTADLAADAAAATTDGGGVLVSLGGDIATAGAAPAGGWSITVADTSDLDVSPGDELEQTIAISSGALATSSVRARRWRRGGVELHHLINPYDGQPAEAFWRTVSVTAGTCVLANAAATAAVIVGSGASDWLTERGFAARLVSQRGELRYVGGWPAEPGSRP